MALRVLHHFTRDEEARLRTLYPTTSAREVAAAMGLTEKQVYNAVDRYQIFKAGYSGERRKPERRNKVYKPRGHSRTDDRPITFACTADFPAWLAPSRADPGRLSD